MSMHAELEKLPPELKDIKINGGFSKKKILCIDLKK